MLAMACVVAPSAFPRDLRDIGPSASMYPLGAGVTSESERSSSDARTAPLPARLCDLKPNVRRPLGSGGPRPLAAGGMFDEEPWQTTDVPFCGTSGAGDSSTPRRRLRNPHGLVRGHPARCPHLVTYSFRYLSTARPPAGRGRCPLASPTRGAPWTPVSCNVQFWSARQSIRQFPPHRSVKLCRLATFLWTLRPNSASHPESPLSRPAGGAETE